MDIYEHAHLFSYSPKTGILTRKSTGKQCNTLRKRKGLAYYQTTVGYKSYLVHRISFLLHFGYLPKSVDHINGVGTDNRPENLRDGDNCVNGQNRMLSDKSKTMVKGVLFRRKRGDYQVTCGGKYIGYAKTLFDAVCIRKSYEIKNNIKGRI